ncbi:hypothetical protein [Methylobacterium radiotolerans]|uniref:Uncharacterized protein n=1 Tax=Methylobacterium radiotolerans (strain ATCC 27329 / DSM 1819 / JCM 2831 / NBRC 15690 / NCIMB 10815 / 0-1) TaxID=426355 RepID=B1MAA3_METRJ|nr:hypothetical protein [Methylobacterium radiotolerans]ACB28428.1 hypothetical protein Mrad2831_6516 [Methylobacterium radiotolerans JCM 2831]GEN01533.1 hypothetical protein MRA01_60720 [Methylobacterium radiotolerans]
MSTKNPIRSRPGRKPSIAAHPACAEIELARAAGDNLQVIADRFGVGRASVDRHWHALPPDRRARLAELAIELREYEARSRDPGANQAYAADVFRRAGQMGDASTLGQVREADANA